MTATVHVDDFRLNGAARKLLEHLLAEDYIHLQDGDTIIVEHDEGCRSLNMGTCDCCPTIVHNGSRHSYLAIIHNDRRVH